MALKKWIIPKENKSLAGVLARECSTSELVASILINRGKSSCNEAMQFLSTDMTIGSPFDLKDMDNAVNRIKDAVENAEKIAVYGDYDCDGITSTAILYSYLISIGAEAVYYIPERDGDGYGLNKSAIDKLSSQDVSLIITVDNGITAVDEVRYAKNLSIDTVITDHHQPSDELPEAIAIVNPHRRDDNSNFKELCGAGVVCKLLIAMEEDLSFVMENYADLIAVGTIGDIVPLVDENRALVKYGLNMLAVSDNIGLSALLKVSGIDQNNITAQNIAFSIVPRINAAGRMGSAITALELLLCEDEEKATELAQKLDEFNKNRQADELKIQAEIDEMLLSDKSLLKQRVLILHNENWNHGIIGIICSRLMERYGKPVMLLSSDSNTSKVYKGSARSLGEFHLFKALNSVSSLLMQFGGHKLAAGFSVHMDDFDEFKLAIESYAKANFDIMPVSTIAVDKILSPTDLTIDSIKELDRLKPFGARNEEPRFMLKGLVLEGITPISNGKHLRLNLKLKSISIQALYFGMTPENLLCKIGDSVDCIVTADINFYNGKESVSIKIKDMRSSFFNETQNKFFAACSYYEKIAKGEDVGSGILDRSIPTRDEIARVHKTLIQSKGFEGDLEHLFIKLLGTNINYCKLRIILDILCEFNLIKLERPTGGIKLMEITGKIDLNQASLLKKWNRTI